MRGIGRDRAEVRTGQAGTGQEERWIRCLSAGEEGTYNKLLT